MKLSVDSSCGWVWAWVVLASACGKKEPDGGGPVGKAADPSAESEPAPPSPAEAWAKSTARVDVALHTIDVDHGALRFVVDVLDPASGDVVQDQPSDALAVSIEGRYVPGKFSVETVREANVPVGVALLLWNYPPPPGDDDAARATQLHDQVERGAKNFLGWLGASDRVAAFVYDPTSLTTVMPWATGAAEAIARIPTALVVREGEAMAPTLYASIKKVASAFVDDEANQPAQRVLVVVSDGNDRMMDKPTIVAKRQQDILETLASIEPSVQIHALGLTLGDTTPLVALQELAVKSGGRYRQVAVDDVAQVADQIVAVAVQLGKRYVIHFTPDKPVGSNQPVGVELALHTKAGAFGRALRDGVKLPPPPPPEP